MAPEQPSLRMRPAQAEDLAQAVRLDRMAFAPLRTDAEIQAAWFSQGISLPGRKLLMATEAGGQTVGSYVQIELEVLFEGQTFPTMGVAAVAVALERRGQRIARFMLEHALETARSHYLPLVMLYPFQHGFYRQLGWAWVESVHQYRVSTRHLPLYRERSHIRAIDPDQQANIVQQVYEQAAPQHNGWLRRQSWQWQDYLKPETKQEIYAYVEAGQPLGYVILQFTQLNPPTNRLAVVVREWVALTPAAYRGIIGFLAALRDQITTIVWNTHATDPFPHLLTEQRQDPTLTTAPFEFGLVHAFGAIGGGFMWRLVDLEAAFELRPIRPGEPFTLTFDVTDPILGDQHLTAEFAAGQMQLRDTMAPVRLQTSVEHLTLMFSGMRRATDLLWSGDLELVSDRPLTLAEQQAYLAQLDTAWSATPPFCWDFF